MEQQIIKLKKINIKINQNKFILLALAISLFIVIIVISAVLNNNSTSKQVFFILVAFFLCIKNCKNKVNYFNVAIF